MRQVPTILVVFLCINAMLMVYLAAWAQVRSKVTAVREFSSLMLAAAIYTLGYAIEISRVDLPEILEAIKFEYLGIAMIPATMLLFALRFSNKKLRWYAYILIFAVPVITIGMVFTIEHHNWYYIRPRVVQGALFPMLDFERGLWYYVNFAYIQAGTWFASILLIFHALTAGAKYRNQVVLITIGSAFPLLSNILYMQGWFGNIDPSPFSLTLTGLVLAIALFKFGLFELVPAARERALDSIRDAFLVVDRHGRLQDLNSAGWRLPGAAELKIGDPLPKENDLVLNLQPLLARKAEQVDFSVNTPGSSLLHFRANAYPILTKMGVPGGIAILVRDVTETASLVRKLNHLASTDELTGLLNRRCLLQFGENELADARMTGAPVGIILIDLDHFKQINDNYGHSAGDIVLKEVVLCFRKVLRVNDILGRYGGDEFVVFLPRTALPTAIQIAERLRQKLTERSLQIDEQNIDITASFGVFAAAADRIVQIDMLLRLADQALYKAKAEGRNRVVWIE